MKIRVIPSLLYRDFGLVKGVRFDSRRAIGAPMQAVKVYNLRNVDELLFLDVAATVRGVSPDLDLVDELADECHMPLTVGGGVRSADDVRALLAVGADKVAVGTAAIEHPSLVEEASGRFGSQCVVASIDFRRDEDGAARVWTRAGTKPTSRALVEVAVELSQRGAGELLVTSIDRDGTMEGYDLEAIRSVTESVSVPVIASGGAGTYDDLAAAILDGGVSAVAAASMFHFTQQTPADAKRHLGCLGIPVRL